MATMRGGLDSACPSRGGASSSHLPAPTSLASPHDMHRSRTWSAGNVSSAVVSEAQQSYLSSCSSSSHRGCSDDEDDVVLGGGGGDYNRYYYGDGEKKTSLHPPPHHQEREFIDVNAAAVNIARRGRGTHRHHRHRRHPDEKSAVTIDIPAEMTHVVIKHSRSNSVDISDRINDGDDHSDISSLEDDEDGTFAPNHGGEKMAKSSARAMTMTRRDNVRPSGDEPFASNDDNDDKHEVDRRTSEFKRTSLFSSTKALSGFEHLLEDEHDDAADYDDAPSEMSYSLSTSSRPVGGAHCHFDVLSEIEVKGGNNAVTAAASTAPRRRGHNKDHSKSSIASLSISSAILGPIDGLNFVDMPPPAAELECATASGASNVFNSSFEDSVVSLLLGNHPSTQMIIQPILSPMTCGLKRSCEDDQQQHQHQHHRWQQHYRHNHQHHHQQKQHHQHHHHQQQQQQQEQHQQQRRLRHRRHRSESILNMSHHMDHSASFGPPPTSSLSSSSNVITPETDRATGSGKRFHRRSLSAGCGVQKNISL
mmetsp:Transcript_16373/g.35636  ORF Transcript_16373/g.35636 Transcript_16373/m.35636 type:complete len:535 (+) Transcript_16373:126-1730(+)